MKKTFLAITILSLFAFSSAQAQEEGSNSDGLLSIGVKLGPNFNRFAETEFLQEVSVGFSGGAFAAVNLLDIITVQGEVLYSIQGGKFPDYTVREMNSVIDSTTYEGVTADFHTLEVPVLIKFNLSPGGAFKIKPYAGASYSNSMMLFQRSTKTMYNGDETFVKEFDLENVGSRFRRNQFSGIFGVSFETTKVTTELRYRFGFNNINPRSIETDPENPNPVYKTQTLSILFGYKIF